MNFGDIINWIKLSPKYILPVFFLTITLLFLPEKILVRFGVDSFVKENRMWIGLIWLASSSLLLSHLGIFIRNKFVNWRQTRLFIKSGKNYLSNLTFEEKAILSKFILFQTKTQVLDISSGITSGLVSAHILYRSSSLGRFTDFSHNIQPWAWEELNAHPVLLEPAISMLRDELEKPRQYR